MRSCRNSRAPSCSVMPRLVASTTLASSSLLAPKPHTGVIVPKRCPLGRSAALQSGKWDNTRVLLDVTVTTLISCFNNHLMSQFPVVHAGDLVHLCVGMFWCGPAADPQSPSCEHVPLVSVLVRTTCDPGEFRCSLFRSSRCHLEYMNVPDAELQSD